MRVGLPGWIWISTSLLLIAAAVVIPYRYQALGPSVVVGGVGAALLLSWVYTWHRQTVKTLIDGIPNPVMIIGKDYKIRYQNQHSRHTCTDVRKSGGRHCYQVNHRRQAPCDGEDNRCPLEQIVRTRTSASVIHRHITKEGERLVRIQGWPLFAPNGEVDAMLETSEDVTETLLSQQRIRESEAHHRAVLNGAPEGFWQLDAKGVVVEVNDALCALLGTSREVLIGKEVTGWVAGHDKVAFRMQMERLVTEGVRHFELHLTDSLGKLQPCYLHASAIPSPGGGLRGSYAFITDIREQKELEASLRKRIESEIRKQWQQEQLLIQQSKMATMGEMVGAIAHQWRQPLNVIALMVQDLREAKRVGELNPEYLDESVEGVMFQLDHMSSTIDEFRDFFKPDRQKEFFPLAPIVDASVHLMRMQLDKRQIAVEWEERVEHAIAYGFPNDIKQVIINILANAKDAIVKRQDEMPKGHIGRIGLTLSERSGVYRLSIANDGGPIPADVLPRLFEPYVTTKGQQGTGIGLYLARMIIEERMGGRIYVENKGEGCCFTIDLPVSSR